MQPQSNVYKWATWILVIVVIILAVMLSRANNETVSDTFGDLGDNVEECRTRLAAWETAYPQGTSTSPAAEEELNDILDDCADVIEAASEEL